MFDGYVFVDEIPNNESEEPVFHIYTRPFDLSFVRLRDSLSIYTTAVLKSVMICSDELRDSINIINVGDVALIIELPNKETLWIKSYATNSKTLNCIVLFKYRDRYTLYAGRFISYNTELFSNHRMSKSLRNLMIQKKIDDLYIDVTTAHIQEINLPRQTCNHIESVIKNFPGYKFHMLIDDFGYEGLIFELMQKGFKICLIDRHINIFRRLNSLHLVEKDSNSADIILVNQLSSDIQRQFEQNKIISIKFDANTTNISGVNGLRIIPFSIHPTISDIIYIANLTAPLHIYPIGESKKISFDWRSLCREL